MIHDRTYRPVPYAPALRLRDADGSMRQAPRRSAGHAAIQPVPPLKGPHETRATDVSYRALAPGGAGFCCRICTGTSESRPTAHYSLLTANSTYTFSAKEKDSETGLSYFGSRYYSSDLSVWLSVDPMSDKYPSLSPFVYCANNPVKVVDPNGEDYEVIIEGNTITIKATYYVTKETKRGVEAAIQNFKEQAPYLSYTSQKGEKYSIQFDLSIAGEFDTPEQAKRAKESSKDVFANYCIEGETKVPPGESLRALGQTDHGNEITIRTDRMSDYRTFTHEIGHSLGFGHWKFGVMGDDYGDTQLFNEYVQQTMYHVGVEKNRDAATPINYTTHTFWSNVGKGIVTDRRKKK